MGGDGVVRPLELLRKEKPTHVVSIADCKARSAPRAALLCILQWFAYRYLVSNHFGIFHRRRTTTNTGCGGWLKCNPESSLYEASIQVVCRKGC